MSAYGKVINGGKPKTSGNQNHVNDKLARGDAWHDSRKAVANQVLGEFWKQPVPVNSTPKLGGVKDGKPSKI